jgi:hypothetical protein
MSTADADPWPFGLKDKLRAARFDVAIEPWTDQLDEASCWYTFTADNPSYGDTDGGEITVQLPTGLSWSVELVRWTMAHHTQAQRLHGTVKAEVTARYLNRVGQTLWF